MARIDTALGQTAAQPVSWSWLYIQPEPLSEIPIGWIGLGNDYDPAHFTRTASHLYVARMGRWHQILSRGTPPLVVFESDDRDVVNWFDFTLELIVGMIGLALGVTIGRRGYKALKPLISRLWSYEAFQVRVRDIGQHALRGDVLTTGWAFVELWNYLWANHRRDLLDGVWEAVRQEFTPGALLVALIRWTARLLSGGVTLLVELGTLIVPLGGKLRP